MPVPSTPTNFLVQKGNNGVYLSWDPQTTATSGFQIQRSTDNVSFSNLGAALPAGAYDYFDSSGVIGTQYWYQVSAINGSGFSPYTAAVGVIATKMSGMSLGEIRLQAQQRADRVNSAFVGTAEWNQFINQSYHELYDLLVTLYEDYYVASPFTFSTDGRTSGIYPLPDGLTVSDVVTSQIAQPFFKLLGVDMGLSGSGNAWASMKKFNFISRNRYVFPQIVSSSLGIFNMRYRIMGNNIQFIPSPGGGQYVKLWYVPRMIDLVRDYDIMDGISGWTEYVIVDAAMKALMKEESDISMLMMQKGQLIKRIEESGMNRDAGQPDTISDVRSHTEQLGGWQGFGDGSNGGW